MSNRTSSAKAPLPSPPRAGPGEDLGPLTVHAGRMSSEELREGLEAARSGRANDGESSTKNPHLKPGDKVLTQLDGSSTARQGTIKSCVTRAPL